MYIVKFDLIFCYFYKIYVILIFVIKNFFFLFIEIMGRLFMYYLKNVFLNKN